MTGIAVLILVVIVLAVGAVVFTELVDQNQRNTAAAYKRGFQAGRVAGFEAGAEFGAHTITALQQLADEPYWEGQ